MIIRAEKNKDYTVLRNTALNDPRLSLKAKGLWAFLMTKPDSWNITSRGLESQVKEGRDSILSTLKELEEGGYLVRGKQRQVNGKFVTGDAILHETPWSGNPATEKPSTENPTVLVNTDKVNTDKVNNNTNVLLSGSALYNQKKPSYGNSDVNEVISTFEEVLGMKLTDRTKQRQYASTLVKQFTLPIVLDGIRFYGTIRTERYAPRIDNIETLFYKFNKLKGYADRRATEQNNSKAVDLDNL